MRSLRASIGRSHGARYRCRGAALVILVAVVSLGPQPALSGDAVKDVPPTATAGRVRPVDLVKASVSQVLAVAQSRTAVRRRAASSGPRFGASPTGCSTSRRWRG